MKNDEKHIDNVLEQITKLLKQSGTLLTVSGSSDGYFSLVVAEEDGGLYYSDQMGILHLGEGQ